MTLRHFWLVSIKNKCLLYSRRFPTAERKAVKSGLTAVPECDEQKLVSAVLSALAITDEDTFDCRKANRLPVVELLYENVALWPVMIIENTGLLYCGLALEQASTDIIDSQSIPLVIETLQFIADSFVRENLVISKLEWLITLNLPFGCLTRKQFLDQEKIAMNKQLEQFIVRIIVRQFVSSAIKANEVNYGKIQLDNLQCLQSGVDGTIEINFDHFDAYNFVISPECTIVDDKILLSISQKNCVIHYKLNQSQSSENPLFTYDYSITKLNNSSNYRFQISVYLLTNLNLKFYYYNIRFKPFKNGEVIKPQNFSATFGQLKIDKETGLSWMIDQKFPKDGIIKLFFDCNINENKLNELETAMNFKTDSSQLNFLKHSNIKLILNKSTSKKVIVNTEFSLVAADYKLIPVIN